MPVTSSSLHPNSHDNAIDFCENQAHFCTIPINQKYWQCSTVQALWGVPADLFFPIKVKWDTQHNESDSYQRFARALDCSRNQQNEGAENKKYWYQRVPQGPIRSHEIGPA